MKNVIFDLVKTEEFDFWFKGQTPKFKAQIEKRLLHIQNHGHFGHAKPLGGGIAEIKFNNGARIYYALISEITILLILGGGKNGQDKDIKKAKSILR